MNQIIVGHFEADGGIIYLPVGFIPDYFRLVDYHTNTNIIVYEWWERMEDDQASGKKEGISYTEGVTANLADDAGITAYDSGSESPTVTTWTESVSNAATARTATAKGTFVKPSTSGTDDTGADADRSAIFECVTAGTSSGTEPTWPSAIGGQVLDGTTLFERVNEANVRAGYQGVCIQDNINTNGQEMYYLAIQADDSVDHGDVDGWTGGIYGT